MSGFTCKRTEWSVSSTQGPAASRAAPSPRQVGCSLEVGPMMSSCVSAVPVGVRGRVQQQHLLCRARLADRRSLATSPLP